MADKLGQPFMPWQSLVADVGGEIDPETGWPAYREVMVTVPRQSGKTTLFLSWQINRCVSRRWKHPQRSVFTAQTGKDARDKWLDELYPLIKNSRLMDLIDEMNRGMGNESIRFRSGSLIRLLSTATSSGHSKTLHQAVMDEIWHDTDDRREQGLRPAMVTVDEAQLLVCSTAGTDGSVVFNRKVEHGRAAVLADSGSGMAYFEWSAPEGWDPEDEASYFTFSPALCPDPPCRCAPSGEQWRHTVTISALRVEREAMKDTPGEYKRAYGNIPTGKRDAAWSVITEAQFTDARDPEGSARDPVAFVIDVTPEPSEVNGYPPQSSCIAVVGERVDEDLHGEIIEHRIGTDWVVARVAELVQRWRTCAVSLVGTAAAFALYPELCAALKAQGSMLEVKVMTNREVAAAFGMTVNALRSNGTARRLRWRPNTHEVALTTAVRGAVQRAIQEGSAWDRVNSSVDISPLVALTNAVHTFVSTAVPPPVGVAKVEQATGPGLFTRPTGRSPFAAGAIR